ncbi:hypothetical protein Peur_028262 [Populus x canadensis]
MDKNSKGQHIGSGGMESDPQSNREEANKLLESDLAIANWAGKRRRRRNCKHRSIFEDLSTRMAFMKVTCEAQVVKRLLRNEAHPSSYKDLLSHCKDGKEEGKKRENTGRQKRPSIIW